MKYVTMVLSAASLLIVSASANAQTAPGKDAPTAIPVEKPVTEKSAPNSGKLTDPAPANKDVTAADANKPPFEGANSFTEAQAKQRISDAGFTSVSTLAKDDKGVWRGTAMKAGKSASVAVDYKGNVVQTN